MAEDQGEKDEEKLELTSERETPGYILLDQARVLALQHARDNQESYGRYANSELVWELISATETEDYYEVRLSYRPAGFRGRPGIEQFTVDKTGPIELRHILSGPRSSNSRSLVLVGSVLIVAVGAIAGGLFASGTFSSGYGSVVEPVEEPDTSVALAPGSATRLISPEGDVSGRKSPESSYCMCTNFLQHNISR